MSFEDDAELMVRLMNLEHQLLDPIFRRDKKSVSALLAPDFREFGSSGRIWSREAILNLLATEPSCTARMLPGFKLTRLAPDAALVTYKTARPPANGQEQICLRSSIWILVGEGWQMIFHQGTKVPPE
jgi:hypothetical protein